MIFEGDVTPQQILEQVGGYQAFLPDDAVMDHDGKSVKLKDLPDIQNAKDLPTLAKNYIESQRELGRRVRIPGKDAKPEETQAFKAKLIETGMLPAPLASPSDYGIAKPEGMADGLQWSEELATNLAATLHKHGAPKELAADLLALHMQALAGSQQGLNASLEAGMAALKTEHGEKFEERQAAATRLATEIFTTPEELEFFEQTGLGNHPKFLSILMRLAPLAMQDSSFVAGMARPTGAMDQGEAVKEHTRVMSDPKHEHYAGYQKGDPKALAYVDSLYRKPAGVAA